MPIKRRTDKRRPDLPEGAIDWLHGGNGLAGGWFYLDAGSEDGLTALWRAHADEIVAEHVAEYLGTRPRRWWDYDAPEPRQRLGGIGTPCHEVLAHRPAYELG